MAGVRQRWPGWCRWPCRCPRPGRVSGCRPDAGQQRGHGGPCGSHPRPATSCGHSRTRSGTDATAGHSRAGCGMRAGHGRTQARGRPPCSAVPWPAVRRGVRCPGCGPTLRSRGPVVSASGPCRSLRVSAATGSGRLTGVRWWGAATGARPAGAAGQAARGAARAHRSWPAAPVPGPPPRARRSRLAVAEPGWSWAAGLAGHPNRGRRRGWGMRGAGGGRTGTGELVQVVGQGSGMLQAGRRRWLRRPVRPHRGGRVTGCEGRWGPRRGAA
jgi:hypothetical protein